MDNSPMIRRLSAVWFADIVGYTALSNIDEEAAIGLVGMLQAISRHIVEQDYGGRVVKYIGDAVLAEFASTDSAVRSAIAVQERYVAASEASGRPSMLRIGVHLGEVIKTQDGDIYGDGVNTASRLQGQAAPGKVLISEDVWRQLRMRTEFHFESLGEVELKGITARVAVFDVLFGGEAALASAKDGAHATAPEKVFIPPVKAPAATSTEPAQAPEPHGPPVSRPLPFPRTAEPAGTAAAGPEGRKAFVWTALAVLLVGGGAGGTYMMLSARDTTAGLAEPTNAGGAAPEAGKGIQAAAPAGEAGGVPADARADAATPGTAASEQPLSTTPAGGASGTSATIPDTRSTTPTQGRSTQTQTGASSLAGGSTAGRAGSPPAAQAPAGTTSPAPPSSGSGASRPPSSQQADPRRSDPPAPLIASPPTTPRVADPTVERELAISQAVATLTDFARAVQERSRAELSGPYRLRSNDMAPLEQVYDRASSGIEASILSPRVRRIDGAGAEIDFLLIIEFVDRQGSPQSQPLPYRAFVARETTGWRITTVQALVG